jgi:hypothetical protein
MANIVRFPVGPRESVGAFAGPALVIPVLKAVRGRRGTAIANTREIEGSIWHSTAMCEHHDAFCVGQAAASCEPRRLPQRTRARQKMVSRCQGCF